MSVLNKIVNDRATIIRRTMIREMMKDIDDICTLNIVNAVPDLLKQDLKNNLKNYHQLSGLCVVHSYEKILFGGDLFIDMENSLVHFRVGGPIRLHDEKVLRDRAERILKRAKGLPICDALAKRNY